MNGEPMVGEVWRSPSGALWIVRDVGETAVTFDMHVTPDGYACELQNEQEYTLGVVDAARGWEKYE